MFNLHSPRFYPSSRKQPINMVFEVSHSHLFQNQQFEISQTHDRRFRINANFNFPASLTRGQEEGSHMTFEGPMKLGLILVRLGRSWGSISVMLVGRCDRAGEHISGQGSVSQSWGPGACGRATPVLEQPVLHSGLGVEKT